MSLFNLQVIPNLITSIRILLVVPVILTCLNQNYKLAFYLFLFASITDAADGLLARWFDCTSKIGAFIDPLADKLLLAGSYIALNWSGHLPLWIVLLVIARDIWILGGVICYFYFIGELVFQPTLLSKLNTFFQILLIILWLIKLSFIAFLSPIITNIVLGAVFLSTVFSFIEYSWIWGKKACSEYKVSLSKK